MLRNGNLLVHGKHDERSCRLPFVSCAPVTYPTLVVILDASLTVRTVVGMHLSNTGYACMDFGTVRSLFQWAQQETPGGAWVPRLLLLSLDLSGVESYQVVQTIHAHPRWRGMRVILTGCNRVLDRLKAGLVGAHGHLAKPLRVEQLLTAVQEHCL